MSTWSHRLTSSALCSCRTATSQPTVARSSRARSTPTRWTSSTETRPSDWTRAGWTTCRARSWGSRSATTAGPTADDPAACRLADTAGVTAALAVSLGVLGLLIGSFLNVVVWRVPRGESIVHPSSHCPSCNHQVRPYDNLPVVSWLVLRGRCRDCHARISVRYPLVELATGIVWAVMAIRFGADAV